MKKGKYIHIIHNSITKQKFTVNDSEARVIVIAPFSSAQYKLPDAQADKILVFIQIKNEETGETLGCPLYVDWESGFEAEMTPPYKKFLRGECALIDDKFYEIKVPLW